MKEWDRMVHGLDALKFRLLLCVIVDIRIYSRDYTEVGGLLVFKYAGATDEVGCERTMIYISYHNNNHFNSVRPPISSQSNGPVCLTGMERLEADMCVDLVSRGGRPCVDVRTIESSDSCPPP